MKKKIKVAKRLPKTYRLTNDRSGLSFQLKVGRKGTLLIMDEEKEIQVPIRHAPNTGTIFHKDQHEHAKVEPIIFYNGYLEVPADAVITQMFLDAHPDNAANNGRWFEEVDDAKEAEEDIAIEERVLEVKGAILAKSKEENGIYELQAVLSVMKGSVVSTADMTPGELKRDLYQEASTNPSYFLNEAGDVTIFDDIEIRMKHMTLMSLQAGILIKSNNGKSMLWGKSKESIITAPPGVSIVDHFSEYLTTDDGLLVQEEIKKRS